MKVAIVDDGICATEVNTKIKRIYINANNILNSNKYSHATICAKIIEKYLNVDCFYDIKFISEDGKSNIKSMCIALEKCLNLSIDIINISNGIEFYYYDMPYYKTLYRICEKLKNKGIIICAAQSNSGRKTIPALFPSVISVEQLHFTNNVLNYPYRRSDLYLHGDHSIIINGNKIITEKCNSYACAYAAALLGKKNSFNTTLYKKAISNHLINYLFFNIKSIAIKSIDVPIILIHSNNPIIYRRLKEEFALHGYYAIVYQYKLYNASFGINIRRNIFLKVLQNHIHGDVIITNYDENFGKESDVIINVSSGQNYNIIFPDTTDLNLTLSEVVKSIIDYYS